MRLSTSIAHMAHDSIKQVRRYTGEPYTVHTDNVRETLSSYTTDDIVIDVGDLHDVVEDVFPFNPAFGYHLILHSFTPEHTFVVSEVTNRFDKNLVPSSTRAHRHDLEARRFQYVSWRGLMVKQADLMDNTKDIVQHDKGFAAIYLKEKLRVLHYMLQNREHARELAEWKLFGTVVEQLFTVAGTMGESYWNHFKAEADRLHVLPYGNVVKA